MPESGRRLVLGLNPENILVARRAMGRVVPALRRRLFSDSRSTRVAWPRTVGSGSERRAESGVVNQTFVKKYFGDENPLERMVNVVMLEL
jgi:hypothetical protein